MIGIINFKNTKVRKIINSIENIIKLSCNDSNKISILIEGVHYCRGYFKEKSREYTSEEISNFSFHISKFTNIYASIFGKKIFINYIHILSFSHVYDYILE